MLEDTVSTPDTKAKAVRGDVKRRVRTVRAWDFQPPVRFASSRVGLADALVVVLRGELGLLLFHSGGKLVQPIRVGGAGNPREFKIPSDTYYTVISLTPESAVLEVQPSPAGGVRVNFLPDTPTSTSDEGKTLWRRWVSYFHPPQHRPFANR